MPQHCIHATALACAPETPPLLETVSKTRQKLDLIRAYPRAAFVIDRPLELVTGPLACDWGMNPHRAISPGRRIVSYPASRPAWLKIHF